MFDYYVSIHNIPIQQVEHG